MSNLSKDAAPAPSDDWGPEAPLGGVSDAFDLLDVLLSQTARTKKD
ncbi:hypothetical protein [Streptomyces sp. NBC_01014]|nr:hypothetical protein OG282_13285 [Streptomyces sp. NBC_01014]